MLCGALASAAEPDTLNGQQRFAREVYQELVQINTTASVGDTYQAAGKTENAQTAWLEALEILSDFGHRDAELVRARPGPSR